MNEGFWVTIIKLRVELQTYSFGIFTTPPVTPALVAKPLRHA
jgi:hypothetical protein